MILRRISRNGQDLPEDQIEYIGNEKALQKIEGLLLFVGMARFELATSWSQTRRDNRATLHPELLVIDL